MISGAGKALHMGCFSDRSGLPHVQGFPCTVVTGVKTLASLTHVLVNNIVIPTHIRKAWQSSSFHTEAPRNVLLLCLSVCLSVCLLCAKIYGTLQYCMHIFL